MDKFGERLKKVRKNKGVQAYVLEDLCGIGRNAIYKYEEGARIPKLDTAVKIAKEMNVSLDYLTGLSEESNPLFYSKK